MARWNPHNFHPCVLGTIMRVSSGMDEYNKIQNYIQIHDNLVNGKKWI
jgi:hypothetical protein